jgi:hypothetical protein
VEWHEIGTFLLTDRWQYSQRVRGIDFKVVYLSTSLSARNTASAIALVNLPENTTDESEEFFKPQRVSPYLPSEIIKFPQPPKNWTYRLGVRQLVLPQQQSSNLRIKIYMPAYSSAPIFAGTTSSATVSTIPVDSTKSVTLSAANPGKVGTTITNNSKTAKLYVSIGIAASLTSYDKVLGYLETYETPFDWNGDIFGIWDKIDATSNARVRDFS